MVVMSAVVLLRLSTPFHRVSSSATLTEMKIEWFDMKFDATKLSFSGTLWSL